MPAGMPSTGARIPLKFPILLILTEFMLSRPGPAAGATQFR